MSIYLCTCSVQTQSLPCQIMGPAAHPQLPQTTNQLQFCPQVTTNPHQVSHSSNMMVNYCETSMMHYLLSSAPDLSSMIPTTGTINKKAKSRLMDKDGRNRNRLSHTSTPLYLAKAKRPAPSDLGGAGATNHLPRGQQPPPRRQRSTHTAGDWTCTDTHTCHRRATTPPVT